MGNYLGPYKVGPAICSFGAASKLSKADLEFSV